MRINFIRHGMTAGNREKRYIGITDEALCEEGILMLREKIFPECSVLISSPMKRCIQTAEIIYPDMDITVCSGLRECDFGRFENRNYIEMAGDEEYQLWIDSGGTMPFPGGEDVNAFRKRCIIAFDKAVNGINDSEAVSFVVHGGTIMSVMERYAFPAAGYYDYSIKNAECLVTDYDGTKITVLEKL